jgi:hypothetical protein
VAEFRFFGGGYLELVVAFFFGGALGFVDALGVALERVALEAGDEAFLGAFLAVAGALAGVDDFTAAAVSMVGFVSR